MDWGKSTVMDLINDVVENPPRGYQVGETDEEAKKWWQQFRLGHQLEQINTMSSFQKFIEK